MDHGRLRISNPKDTFVYEYETMLEWVGGEFDPDAFDMNFINAQLNDLKL